MRLARFFVLFSFLIAFGLSVSGWFERFSPEGLFGFGAFASASSFTILHTLDERFRLYVRARSLKRLTLVQVFRFFGTLAFVKAYQHVLPPLFAIPTGIIDVVFAGSSFYVARNWVRPQRRPPPLFFVWHIAGLAGLGVSVVLAFVTSPKAMTVFPMSLVPSFIGPLVLVFHLLALSAAPHQIRQK